MKVIPAILVSYRERKKGKGPGAQVRVVGFASEFGFPGPERIMSINRHVDRAVSGFVGNNVNYLAPGFNDAAEKRSANASFELGRAKSTLESLEIALKNFAKNNAELSVPLKGIEITATKDELRKQIRKADICLAEAEAEVLAAAAHLEKIQTEFPRLCQFTF